MGMNCIRTEDVSRGRASIHSDIQGLHYTLMGRDGEPIVGVWVQGGNAMYWCWETHRQAIWHDEEAPFPAPPFGPSTSSCVPFMPHCVLLQCLASWPTRHLPHSFALSRFPYFLPGLTVSPDSMYPFTLSHWELKQRWISSEGNRWESCFWIEGECNLWFFWSSADLLVAPVQICCWTQGTSMAPRLAAVYLTSLLTAGMCCC